MATDRITRREAAARIMVDYNQHEARRVSFKTIYNRVFWDSQRESWRLIGYAHDYTAA